MGKQVIYRRFLGQELETFNRNRMSQYPVLPAGVQRCRRGVGLLHFTL